MKIQSYVDLITNSSTSVFTWADNIEGVKEIINAVLKASGSNLTCDDLFEITISYNVDLSDTDGYYIEAAKAVLENNEDKELSKLVNSYDEVISQSRVDWYKESIIYEAIYNILIKNYGEKTLDEWAEDFNTDSYDYKYSSYYIIKARNSEYEKYADKIASKLGLLFSYDASYC